MENFVQLGALCEKTRMLSADVLDDFLIGYTATKTKAGDNFDHQIKAFGRLLKNFPSGSKGLFKSQYIAHKIFKKEGLIHSLLKHSGVKDLLREEKEYLLAQSDTPWRFSFSTIKSNPHKYFYQMEDEFRGERFLLYSPGTDGIQKMHTVGLWMNLIGFNGQCWQSFGPIGHYQSFEPDDIFFFATELNPAIETDEDLTEDVENNPIPYLMLMSGATLPRVEHGGRRIIFLKSYHDMPALDKDKLKEMFLLKENGHILKLEAGELDGFPDFARAYYSMDTKELELCAMTENGYGQLVNKLKKCDINIPDGYDMRVNPTMFTTAANILNKKLVFDEKESLFAEETSPADQEGVDKMNALLQLLMPVINANKKPDYKALEKETGFDVETIMSLEKQINEMRFRDRP